MFSRYSRASLGLLTLALYGGPVLAGLARHRWSVLPVFAALLLLYVAATRKPNLATPAGWAGLAWMAAVQVSLVVLAWAAGMAAARITGPFMLPLWAPLAVTAAAAGFGVWAFRDAAEMDVMLDSVLAALEARPGAVAAWPEPGEEIRDRVDRAVRELRAQPRDPGSVDPVVQALEADLGVGAFDAFYDCASGEARPDDDPQAGFGLLRFIASPALLAALIARGEGGLAPVLLLGADDPGVRAEARRRVFDLVKLGAPPEQLPAVATLAELAVRHPGEGYEALLALCEGG